MSAPPPAAGREVLRHLRDLGLESVHAYQQWCRDHGFRTALEKSWHERREEIRHAQRLAEGETVREELARHIAALGLRTRAEYEAWCTANGFGPGERKSRDQLRRELTTAERAAAQAALERSADRKRRPEDAIRRIYAGDSTPDLHRSPYLAQVSAAFASAGDAAVREAFLRLLLHTYRYANFTSIESVIPYLGPAPENRFVFALLALARRHASWVRDPLEWRPDTRNAVRQFHSLALHLLARYPVPAFMDAAWFEGDSMGARRHQEWFMHIGTGANIRTADLPLRLTKMMAHRVVEAPDDLPVDAALRWGQVLGLDGSEYLAGAVIATRLGEIQPDEPFWLSFLHFLVNNPMLDAAWIGPIVDYVHHVRFEPREVDGEGTVVLGPVEPEFTMKGRTVPALWLRVEAWHEQLGREARKVPQEWEPADIGALELEERDPRTGVVQRWIIRELRTTRELAADGRDMRTCVASYARSCAKRSISIWSMQVHDADGDRHKRVMTIEVNHGRRLIVQARGRHNRKPGQRHASMLLERAPEILKLWASREKLGIVGYL